MRIPLLDLGNVVVQVDFNSFFSWIASRSEVQDLDELRKFTQSSLWADYEFGNIEKPKFIQRARTLLRASFTDVEFEDKFSDIFPGAVPGMEKLIEDFLAAGPVYCLSNTNEIHQVRFLEQFPILRKVTKIFASHEIRKRKPYPGTYRDVVNEIGTSPKNVLFFDDLRENVEGARRAGLDAHIFQSAERTRSLWQGE